MNKTIYIIYYYFTSPLNVGITRQLDTHNTHKYNIQNPNHFNFNKSAISSYTTQKHENLYTKENQTQIGFTFTFYKLQTTTKKKNGIQLHNYSGTSVKSLNITCQL